MPETEHSEAGALIAGRYRLGEAIGHGGMATVFRARDEKLGRTVAVKVFTTGEPDPDDTARRVREMRLLAAANHPHLVTLFDAEWPTAEAPRPGFLVMELVEGQSLRRHLDRSGPDAELARRVAIELSQALAYLHEQGIVHRDLKPENILIDEGTGATKLVDFGIAQFVGAERITTDGTVLGTAAYLSPEQVRGDAVAPAADVYALGLVVLECLTGKRVFAGPAVEAAIARLTSDPPIPSGLPGEWTALLTAMTAREPDARPDAAAVAVAASGLDVPTLPEIDGDTITMTAPARAEIFAGGGAYANAAAGATGPTLRLPAAEASVAPDSRWSSSTPSARIETPSREQTTDASRPRRRGGVLVGALAALLVGSAAAAFALAGSRHDANADSTTPSTPVPTVTVTARAPQPATTPAVQTTQTTPSPLSGTGAGGPSAGTGAVSTGVGAGSAGAGAKPAPAPGAGHGKGHGAGAGHGKNH